MHVSFLDKPVNPLNLYDLKDFQQGIQTEYSIKNLSPITRLIQARAALPDLHRKPLRNLVVTFGAELGLSFEEAAHIESSMATSTNFCILNFPIRRLTFLLHQ